MPKGANRTPYQIIENLTLKHQVAKSKTNLDVAFTLKRTRIIENRARFSDFPALQYSI